MPEGRIPENAAPVRQVTKPLDPAKYATAFVFASGVTGWGWAAAGTEGCAAAWEGDG
jgi:hypothetical protein